MHGVGSAVLSHIVLEHSRHDSLPSESQAWQIRGIATRTVGGHCRGSPAKDSGESSKWVSDFRGRHGVVLLQCSSQLPLGCGRGSTPGSGAAMSGQECRVLQSDDVVESTTSRPLQTVGTNWDPDPRER